MSSTLTRRNILKLAGGSVLGFLLSPMPWKTLDDVSIWTQNWSWIPKVPRGPITHKFTSCSLCPSACSVKARMTSGKPVSLWGLPGTEIRRGALCSIGLAGHHLAFHPTRIRETVRVKKLVEGVTFDPVSPDDLVAHLATILREIQSHPREGTFALLDGRPGGMTSDMHRLIMSHLDASTYILPDAYDGCFMEALGEMTEEPTAQYGLNLSRTRTILNFGASLFEGWGSSPQVLEQFRSRRNELTIIQVDPQRSASAVCANHWIPIKPGSETAFALGLANVIIRERLHDPSMTARAVDLDRSKPFSFMDLTRQFPPSRVSSLTEIPEQLIVETARQFASDKPAIALADDFSGEVLHRIVWGLNALVGAIGKEGSVSHKHQLPRPWKEYQQAPVTRLSEIPDHSIRLLIVDGSLTDSTIPWSTLHRKLRSENCTVVHCSPYQPQQADLIDYIFPVHAPYETYRDTPTGSYSRKTGFSISAPLWNGPQGTCEAWQLLQRIVTTAGISLKGGLAGLQPSNLLRSQTDAIFHAKRGALHLPAVNETVPVIEVTSSDEFHAAILDGAVWSDEDVAPPSSGKFLFLGKSVAASETLVRSVLATGNLASRDANEFPLLLVPVDREVASRFAQVSPIMSKLYQESGLKPSPQIAHIHHETAERFDLVDNGKVVIRSTHGSTEAVLRFDGSVRPDTVEVSASKIDTIRSRHGALPQASEIMGHAGREQWNHLMFVRIERA